MSDEKLEQNGLSRRSFLGTAAVSGAGIAGAGLLGLAGCSKEGGDKACLLYTSPSPRDRQKSRMPSSA